MIHQFSLSNQMPNTDFTQPPFCCFASYKKLTQKVVYFSKACYHTAFLDPLLHVIIITPILEVHATMTLVLLMAQN
jgi:multisubunit Na+/H+ antiporter MnhC subunit